MKKIVSTLAASLVICTSVAFGAVKEGSFSATPLVGGYIYDDDQNLDATLVFGLRAGYNFTKHIGIEALYDYAASTDASSGSLTGISLHRFGGQALYHFLPDSNLVPYLAAGLSDVKLRGNGVNSRSHGAFDYGAGVKYFLNDDFALRGDVRHILYNYNATTFSNVEFSLGAYVQFGDVAPVVKAIEPAPVKPAPEPEVVKAVVVPTAPPEPPKVVIAPLPEPVKAVAVPVPVPPADSDGDGVIDLLDKCPGTPARVTVDSNGCPVDSDKDGVPDYLDKCPGTPAGVAVDASGCAVDTDRDGVADYLDKCPATPAGVAVDANGCPADTDKDGVADYLDKCSGTPAGAVVDANGCPVDSDKDGVADYLDKCPGTVEGVVVDVNGCPVEAAKRFCDKPTVIAVSFDANKTDVKAKYHDELDKLGSFLKEFPNSKGTIEGHTDADGSKDANQKLSQARAESVREYIVKKFAIDGSRVTATGHGSNKPVASNKTAAGKAKNRRIEAVFTCE